MVPAAWVVQAQKFRRWFQRRGAALFETVDVMLAPATPCVRPELGPDHHGARRRDPERAGQSRPVHPADLASSACRSRPCRSGSDGRAPADRRAGDRAGLARGSGAARGARPGGARASAARRSRSCWRELWTEGMRDGRDETPGTLGRAPQRQRTRSRAEIWGALEADRRQRRPGLEHASPISSGADTRGQAPIASCRPGEAARRQMQSRPAADPGAAARALRRQDRLRARCRS